MIQNRSKKSKKGVVYLVGAGPGDPGLLTLRAAELLKKADAVVYDGLVHPALLDLTSSRAEKIYAGRIEKLPDSVWFGHSRTSKTCAHLQNGNRPTPQLLVDLALEGKQVVRLKGGDPFVFGRGGEEASFLKEHEIDYEIVPGVSAGFSVPAYAGIPVTDRRFASSVTFVTAHEGLEKKEASINWKKMAEMDGTLVCFMGVQSLPGVVNALMTGGKPPETPVSVIQWGTLPRQRVIEGVLGNIAQKVARAKIGSPAITVIGEVNRLRKQIAWFEKRVLKSNGAYFEKNGAGRRARQPSPSKQSRL